MEPSDASIRVSAQTRCPSAVAGGVRLEVEFVVGEQFLHLLIHGGWRVCEM